MARYVTHFCNIQWKTLLHMANLSESNLPTLPKYMGNGNNGLYYAYILGKYQGRICRKHPDGHAPVLDVTDAFSRDLSQMLAAEVERRLAKEPPTTQQYSHGMGTSPKKYKRTT
jgi:hypothetical protein